MLQHISFPHGRAKEEAQLLRGRALVPRAKGELIAPGSGAARARPILRFSSFFSLRVSACILHPCSHAAAHGSVFASPPTLRRNLPTIPPCYSLARQRSARGCSATRHWDLGPLQAFAGLQVLVDQVGASAPRVGFDGQSLPYHGGVCSSSLIMSPHVSRRRRCH